VSDIISMHIAAFIHLCTRKSLQILSLEFHNSTLLGLRWLRSNHIIFLIIVKIGSRAYDDIIIIFLRKIVKFFWFFLRHFNIVFFRLTENKKKKSY